MLDKRLHYANVNTLYHKQGDKTLILYPFNLNVHLDFG